MLKFSSPFEQTTDVGRSRPARRPLSSIANCSFCCRSIASRVSYSDLVQRVDETRIARRRLRLSRPTRIDSDRMGERAWR